MTRGPDPDVTGLELLNFVLQTPDPAMTALEVAKEFEHTRQWANQRLDELEEDGLLKSKNPGGRSRLFWITDDGRRALLNSNE